MFICLRFGFKNKDEEEDFDEKEEERKYRQRMAQEEADFNKLTKQSDFLVNQAGGGDGMDEGVDD